MLVYLKIPHFITQLFWQIEVVSTKGDQPIIKMSKLINVTKCCLQIYIYLTFLFYIFNKNVNIIWT